MRILRALSSLFGRGAQPHRRTAELPAETLETWLGEGRAIQLLDIRDAAAFQQGHLPTARHIPLDRLEQGLSTLDRCRATVLY
jgi:rhodanese-related sulfurtransferase